MGNAGFLYHWGSGLHLIEQAAMLRVAGLKKVFRSGEADLVLFENLSFQVTKGEMSPAQARAPYCTSSAPLNGLLRVTYTAPTHT